MPTKSNPLLTRRELLSASVLAGGSLLIGAGLLSRLWAADGFVQRPGRKAGQGGGKGAGRDPFAGGKQIGTIDFAGERRMPMETALGAELDGRLYTDLSVLTP